MTKKEVLSFIKKIKAYYPLFNLSTEEALDEWAERLKPYDNEDVLRKLEEHLNGERADEPPKLHFITKYLITTKDKEKYKGDYLIRCNLCGREMYLSDYDKKHYDKCLLIKTLLPILKDRGEDVTYEILEEYDYSTLDKIWNKYSPSLITDKKEVGVSGRINNVLNKNAN